MSCLSRTPLCLEDLIVGETGQWQITVTDQDDAAVDLAGATIEMRFVARDAIRASLTVGDGLTVTDEPSGLLTATLETTGMNPWAYDVYLIVTDSGARVHMQTAKVRILPSPATT